MKKLVCSIMLMVAMFVVSVSAFSADLQETTASYSEDQSFDEYYKETIIDSEVKTEIRKSGLSKELVMQLMMEEEYLGLVEVFAADIECHPGVEPEEFYEAKFGEPFQTYGIDDEGNAEISDKCYFVPLINEYRILAMISVVTNEKNEVFGQMSQAYCFGINELIESSGSGLIKMVFTDGGLFASNGNGFVDVLALEWGKLPSVDAVGAKSLSYEVNVSELEQELIKSVDVLKIANNGNTTISQAIDSARVNNTTRAVTTKLLNNYPTVNQGNNPTCWAGAIATMVNYEFSQNITPNTITYNYHKMRPGQISDLDIRIPEPENWNGEITRRIQQVPIRTTIITSFSLGKTRSDCIITSPKYVPSG